MNGEETVIILNLDRVSARNHEAVPASTSLSPVEAHAREKARVELLPVRGGKGLQERAVGHGGGVPDLAPVVLHAHRTRLGERRG